MKKVCFFAYVMCSCCFAKDLSIEEISDTVRELTGRIEALEKKISDNGSNEASVASSESQEDFEKLVTGQNPEDLIRQIITHIDENDMNYARGLVDAFLKLNPDNIFCGMMLFHKGESYFREKDYKNAAMAYMQSFKKNATGSKSAEALYKLALCFNFLDENEKCKATLEKIVRDYPGEFAEKAKRRLKKFA